MAEYLTLLQVPDNPWPTWCFQGSLGTPGRLRPKAEGAPRADVFRFPPPKGWHPIWPPSELNLRRVGAEVEKPYSWLQVLFSRSVQGSPRVSGHTPL